MRAVLSVGLCFGLGFAIAACGKEEAAPDGGQMNNACSSPGLDGRVCCVDVNVGACTAVLPGTLMGVCSFVGSRDPVASCAVERGTLCLSTGDCLGETLCCNPQSGGAAPGSDQPGICFNRNDATLLARVGTCAPAP
jgi:hypothetical protein